jgi:UDP-N-acetylmuramoyl-L-alanyl-D-glutamate--2,6-diaminopimelate ligase
MVDAGVKCLVMEVSSQAIYMDRIFGIEFDTCVFTNLYVDHIGGVEHPSFEHYRDCKRALFTDFGAKNIIYNADDEYAEYMISDSDARKISCSCDKDCYDFYASGIEIPKLKDTLSVSFDITFGKKTYKTYVSMPGKFSVYNALLTIAICYVCGISPQKTTELLPSVSIDGRFEIISNEKDSFFVIDYAHNGASLGAALTALRAYNPKRLICLFGSVGGRTFNRRRELGEVAAKLADFCILTSDNPSFESPDKIIDDIAACFNSPDSCDYVKIPDRREAIRYAVKKSRRGDIVLLAGKGHETYQLIGDKKLPFSERAIILEALEESIKV